MGVVAVLGSDDHADHDVGDGGETRHPFMFANRGSAPPSPD
jgi:hypothetical protein